MVLTMCQPKLVLSDFSKKHTVPHKDIMFTSAKEDM